MHACDTTLLSTCYYREASIHFFPIPAIGNRLATAFVSFAAAAVVVALSLHTNSPFFQQDMQSTALSPPPCQTSTSSESTTTLSCSADCNKGRDPSGEKTRETIAGGNRDTDIPIDWPFDSAEAFRRQAETAKRMAVPIEVTNSIGMKLRLIPAGEFVMGAKGTADAEAEAALKEFRQHVTKPAPVDVKSAVEYDPELAFVYSFLQSERPAHRVRITTSFYIGVTEVTQGQWKAVMKSRPWTEENQVKEGPQFAASCISWEDAVEFCKRLSTQEGFEYRLPTEAEWEYSCRAGTDTHFSFGDNAARLGLYAWWGGMIDDGNCQSEKYAHPVSVKKPNPWGLYDMHGNVLEWCIDWFDRDYYNASTKSDPTGPVSGSCRVYRGGSWIGSARGCRSASRDWNWPDQRDCDLGFRVCRMLPQLQ